MLLKNKDSTEESPTAFAPAMSFPVVGTKVTGDVVFVSRDVPRDARGMPG